MTYLSVNKKRIKNLLHMLLLIINFIFKISFASKIPSKNFLCLKTSDKKKYKYY